MLLYVSHLKLNLKLFSTTSVVWVRYFPQRLSQKAHAHTQFHNKTKDLVFKLTVARLINVDGV